MFKKVLLLSFFLFSIAYGTQLSLDVSAPAAVLINAETGSILFEKNAKSPAFPASITKVATALYVFHLNKDLEELITAKQEAIASITPQAKKQSNYRSPAYWLETDGTHMGIKKGEMISLHDLLYGMLVCSANDAANVIAQHISGTIPQFMSDLNAYLQSIGCKDTHFCNPHGLHHPDHVSTPYDMALIAKEAMKYPLFRQMVSATRYTCGETNLQGPRYLIQTNHLIRNGKHYYPKAIGIKTGYHSLAGKTLIAAAKDDGRYLISVVFGCQSAAERYKDSVKMFDTAFNQPKLQKKLLSKGLQNLTLKIKGAQKPIKTYLKEDVVWEYYSYDEETIKLVVKWNLFSLPLAKDEIVGYLKIVNETEQVLREIPLFSFEEVNSTIWLQIKSAKYFKWILIGIIGLCCLVFVFIKRPKSKLTRYI